jgi:hypothetical protein
MGWKVEFAMLKRILSSADSALSLVIKKKAVKQLITALQSSTKVIVTEKSLQIIGSLSQGGKPWRKKTEARTATVLEGSL